MKRKQEKRYYGEEAERVNWKDCAAANMLIAKMKAGQFDPASLVVEAPKSIWAVVVD